MRRALAATCPLPPGGPFDAAGLRLHRAPAARPTVRRGARAAGAALRAEPGAPQEDPRGVLAAVDPVDRDPGAERDLHQERREAVAPGRDLLPARVPVPGRDPDGDAAALTFLDRHLHAA